MQTTLAAPPSATDRRVARALLDQIDALLAAVPDDPALQLGLRRERQRLLLRLSPFVAVRRQPTPRSPLRPAPRRLRSACYRALFTGLIDGSRFDAMMVLGARAGRRLVAPPASESSPSSSLSLPSPGARGVGAAGRAGDAPSARR